MKNFTLEEALEALPEIALHAQRMVDARVALLEAEQPESRLTGTARANGSGPAQKRTPEEVSRAEQLRQDLRSALDAIEGMGVLVKDVDTGLVDFPSLHTVTGEPVFLCWQLGEESIDFWHAQDTGFAGRKPLPFSQDEG